MYFPKSMIRKIAPGLGLDLDLNKIIDKLLDKVFAGSNANAGTGGTTKESGFPGATLSTNDVTVFQTRNLEIYAVPTEDYDKGDFSNAVFVANEVPIDSDSEPVINRHFPRPLRADYERTFFDRYVLYDIRNGEIIEVSQDDYVKFRSLRYKRSGVISWYILGKADDYQIGQYIYPGVRNNNIDVLVQQEVTIPGVSDYFDDKTQYLLESLDDYTGDPEIVNIPDPPDDTDEEENEDIEDIGFGDGDIDLPDPPDLNLPEEDIIGDLQAADESLGALSASLEEVAAEQQAIAEEYEEDVAEQEQRLADIEGEQERIRRQQELLGILMDRNEVGGWYFDIINMSSKARRKKKRHRLDQGRDEDKIRKIAAQICSSKYEQLFTGEELVIVVNKSGLTSRLKLKLTSDDKIKADWTRDGQKYYNKNFFVFKVTGEHARRYSDGSPTTESAEGKTGEDNPPSGQGDNRDVVEDYAPNETQIDFVIEEVKAGGGAAFVKRRGRGTTLTAEGRKLNKGGEYYQVVELELARYMKTKDEQGKPLAEGFVNNDYISRRANNRSRNRKTNDDLRRDTAYLNQYEIDSNQTSIVRAGIFLTNPLLQQFNVSRQNSSQSGKGRGKGRGRNNSSNNNQSSGRGSGRERTTGY